MLSLLSWQDNYLPGFLLLPRALPFSSWFLNGKVQLRLLLVVLVQFPGLDCCLLHGRIAFSWFSLLPQCMFVALSCYLGFSMAKCPNCCSCVLSIMLNASVACSWQGKVCWFFFLLPSTHSCSSFFCSWFFYGQIPGLMLVVCFFLVSWFLCCLFYSDNSCFSGVLCSPVLMCSSFSRSLFSYSNLDAATEYL